LKGDLSMNQKMRVELLGTSFASVDGAEYASVYVGQEAEKDSTTAKGIEVMKMTCTPDVFRSLPAAGYPLQVELETKLKKVAGGKLGQVCIAALVVPKAAVKASV